MALQNYILFLNIVLKIQINFIFVLTNLYNFIKDYPSQDIDYFETKNDNSIIPFDESNNLFLGSSLIISIQINKKKNTIAYAICMDYISYLI